MNLFYSVLITVPEDGNDPEELMKLIKDIRVDIERGIEKEAWAPDVIFERKE
jgi:hypothetical protein